MRDPRRQGLRIIDLTTRLNDLAVTVSPDLLSSSPGITIRETTLNSSPFTLRLSDRETRAL